MAIFLGAKGGDIVATQSATHLLAAVREKLAAKMAYLLVGEDEALLCGLRDRIGAELDFEEECSRLFRLQMEELSRLEFADQLPDACSRFTALARDHFNRRGSVIAFHGLYAAFLELLLRRALALAEACTETAPSEPNSCCLMATGDAGRGESLPGTVSRYFLIYPDLKTELAGCFEEMGYRLIALLESCGIFAMGHRFSDDSGLWQGSESQWRSWCSSRIQRGEKVGETLALLGDLRGVAGDKTLMAGMKSVAAEALSQTQEKDIFAQAVRKLSSLPVALGMFGTLKTLRSGEHRGRFKLHEAALHPLMINVRILAVHHGLQETGTIGRIKGLVDGGHLAVDLADRLLRAYHLLAGCRIRHAIVMDDWAAQEFYLNPDELGEEDAYQFKGALEAVVNLQKLVYQLFSEQG
ncbi:putative nucleotidyltransferase substrate binding domain-containing protein [Geotalea sp. SG265]|uniref:putative nucleotidyltransferase substrate binding domain-containing protein n=1 Tax=Geotalea sp. SG265 TaxID=2922867 RepID=UPI001FAF4E21|nr:putative nucleotidyltransferase substrate binding domain-containing protein [Geotalea sp. SG265]